MVAPAASPALPVTGSHSSLLSLGGFQGVHLGLRTGHLQTEFNMNVLKNTKGFVSAASQSTGLQEGALRLCYWRLRPGPWGCTQSTGYPLLRGPSREESHGVFPTQIPSPPKQNKTKPLLWSCSERVFKKVASVSPV